MDTNNPVRFSAGASSKIRLAANTIVEELLWEGTPQGEGYWKQVYENLWVLHEEAKKWENTPR